jgi:hypothetical protein
MVIMERSHKVNDTLLALLADAERPAGASHAS